MKVLEISTLLNAGARTNKYRIIYPDIGRDLDIMCKSASMPGKEIGTVEVYIKGRKYKMAGETSDAGEWQITIYNDENFEIRNFFLRLIERTHDNEIPITMGGAWSGFCNLGYMSDIFVQQLDSKGDVKTEATLLRAFVTSVGPIEYTDEVGEVSTSEISFSYSGMVFTESFGINADTGLTC